MGRGTLWSFMEKKTYLITFKRVERI